MMLRMLLIMAVCCGIFQGPLAQTLDPYTPDNDPCRLSQFVDRHEVAVEPANCQQLGQLEVRLFFTDVSITARTNFAYNIDDGDSWYDSWTFVNLQAGTYRVKYRSKKDDCVSNVGSVAVPFEAPTDVPVISRMEVMPASGCTGSSGLGQLVVQATGGQPPYWYRLNDGEPQRSNRFQSLPYGPHQIEVFNDDPNCGHITQPFEVPYHAGVTIQNVVVTQAGDCAQSGLGKFALK